MVSAEVQRLYGFDGRMCDGRRSSSGRKTGNIKQLWQRSHEIINMASLGMKHTEIAKELNITTATVSNTVNSELGQKKISEIRKSRDEYVKECNEKVMDLTEKALNFYTQVLDSPANDPMKLKVADTVMLELSGLRVPTKTQSNNLNLHATMEDINNFKRRGLEAARLRGDVVDVDYEEV